MRRYWPLLVVLASLWGSSYLFIKVGVDGGLSPSALMFGRTLLIILAIGAAVLGVLKFRQRRQAEAFEQAEQIARLER